MPQGNNNNNGKNKDEDEVLLFSEEEWSRIGQIFASAENEQMFSIVNIIKYQLKALSSCSSYSRIVAAFFLSL